MLHVDDWCLVTVKVAHIACLGGTIYYSCVRIHVKKPAETASREQADLEEIPDVPTQFLGLLLASFLFLVEQELGEALRLYGAPKT